MKGRFWYLLIGFIVSAGLLMALFFLVGGSEIFKGEFGTGAGKGLNRQVFEKLDTGERRRLNEARKLSQEGDLKGAIKIIEKVLKGRPKNIESRLLLGELYIREGRYDKASENIELVLRFQPRNSWAFRARGVLYRAGNKPELAEESFKKAIGFAGKNEIDKAFAHFELGRLCLKQGDEERAIGNFKEAIKYYSEEPTFQKELAAIESRE